MISTEIQDEMESSLERGDWFLCWEDFMVPVSVDRGYPTTRVVSGPMKIQRRMTGHVGDPCQLISE
jgi:hypothetical protein